MTIAIVGAARSAEATCSSNQCTIGGASYYVDYTCPGSGTCNAPSSGCDACPGHCNQVPSTVCISNTPCTTGGDFCNYSTTSFFGTCDASSGSTAGQACASNAQCDPDGGGPLTGTCSNYVNPYGGDGLCTITDPATGNHTINGTSGNDVICGVLASDTINGGAGNDIIAGGATGGNTIHGDAGDDVIYSGASGTTANVMYGDGGNNTIYGGQYADTIFGGSGDDLLFGGAGNDIIAGQAGRDVIWGEDGDDWLLSTYLAPGPHSAPFSVVATVTTPCTGQGLVISAWTEDPVRWSRERKRIASTISP